MNRIDPKRRDQNRTSSSSIDLHSHTTFSDGRSSPAQLLAEAQRRGLRTLAITDHESLRGYREAQPLAARLGVELVPAIELTTAWPGYSGHGGGPDVDVLGYFLEPESPLLRAGEERFLADLTARIEEACALLARQGFALGAADVLRTNPSYPGYVPLLDTLERRGASRSAALAAVGEVWPRLPPARLGIGEAIGFIHDAGGIAVLAHPSIVHREDGEPLAERGLAELVEMGLDGLEVLHYRLSSAQRRHFALLARMFELPVSGGSDEHGGPEVFPRLAQEAVTPEMLAALRARRPARPLSG